MTSAVGVIATPPTVGSVVLGIVAVILGALLATGAAHRGWRTGNWLYHLGTVAGLLIVVGIAGQRTVADGAAVGPWDAGIALPLLGIRLTPVTASGLILALLCLTLVLLFEHVPEAPPGGRAESVHRPLDDDDAV